MNYHFLELLAQVKVFVVKLYEMFHIASVFDRLGEIIFWVTLVLHQRLVLLVHNFELNLTVSHLGKLHALFYDVDSPLFEANHSCFWIVYFFYNNFASAHLFVDNYSVVLIN